MEHLTARERIENYLQEARIKRVEQLAKEMAGVEPMVRGPFKFYSQRHCVEFQDTVFSLPYTPYAIAEMLASSPQTTFTRNMIMDLLGMDDEWTDRTIDSHIKRIRRPFQKATRKTYDPIKTIYKVGYHWNDNYGPNA